MKMVASLISVHHFLLFLVLVQSVSLYKIYALDNNPSALLTDSLSSSLNRENNQMLPIKNTEYNNNDDDTALDTNHYENNDNIGPWLSYLSKMTEDEKSSSKRSIFPIKLQSSKSVVNRRNSRPHWNPLVAAYKRCGELSTPDDRESCFKDAVQRLFVFKLRK